ncbi:MAG: methionyl-tRNA formyltransferase [Candidatus Gastranaerophilaceae bacterium]
MFTTKKFKKRILFVGIPDMAYVCLDGLLAAGVNIVGVMGPKKSHSTYLAFKNFVVSRHLNFIEWDDLKSPKLLQNLDNLDIDAAVVASFNYKIPKELLSIPKHGFINIHPSLLPKYRGGNPYSTVIINNEHETGVTLHFMDEGFDTGDVILQKKVEISPIETMGTLFNRLNLLGMQMLVSALGELEKRDLPRYKQPDGEFVVGKSIKDEDLFIDFKQSAADIERFIRALNPFLIASAAFRGNMIKIFMAECEKTDLTGFECGTIVKITDDKFYIMTGDGLIAPTAIQFGSFFVGNAKDFINILNPKVGEVFN